MADAPSWDSLSASPPTAPSWDALSAAPPPQQQGTPVGSGTVPVAPGQGITNAIKAFPGDAVALAKEMWGSGQTQEQPNPIVDPLTVLKNTPSEIGGIASSIYQKYGSLQKLQNSIEQHPAHVLADAVGAFTGLRGVTGEAEDAAEAAANRPPPSPAAAAKLKAVDQIANRGSANGGSIADEINDRLNDPAPTDPSGVIQQYGAQLNDAANGSLSARMLNPVADIGVHPWKGTYALGILAADHVLGGAAGATVLGVGSAGRVARVVENAITRGRLNSLKEQILNEDAAAQGSVNPGGAPPPPPPSPSGPWGPIPTGPGPRVPNVGTPMSPGAPPIAGLLPNGLFNMGNQAAPVRLLADLRAGRPSVAPPAAAVEGRPSVDSNLTPVAPSAPAGQVASNVAQTIPDDLSIPDFLKRNGGGTSTAAPSIQPLANPVQATAALSKLTKTNGGVVQPNGGIVEAPFTPRAQIVPRDIDKASAAAAFKGYPQDVGPGMVASLRAGFEKNHAVVNQRLQQYANATGRADLAVKLRPDLINSSHGVDVANAVNELGAANPEAKAGLNTYFGTEWIKDAKKYYDRKKPPRK